MVHAWNDLNEYGAAAHTALLRHNKYVPDSVHADLAASLHPLPHPRVVAGCVYIRHDLVHYLSNHILLAIPEQCFELVGHPQNPAWLVLLD